MHVDAGFEDAAVPGPASMLFPTLLDGMTAPHLLAYNDETTVAEKFEDDPAGAGQQPERIL